MIVYRWTGLESKVLREAMQCSIEGFAKRVGVGVRTVADWEARGKAAVMRPSSRALLDKALMNAPAEVLARFQRTMEGFPSGGEQPATGLLPTVTLANDALDVVPTVGGVDAADHVWVPARTAAGEVVLVSLPRRTLVAGLGAGAIAAAVGVKPAPVLGGAVDHVDHFRALRMALIENDNLCGSRPLVPLIEQSIETMIQLRRARATDARDLQRIQILYAEFAAWLHQDGHNWGRAQHWTDRALTWSHQLGDDYGIAATLIRKAQCAVDMGDGTEAVELAEAAERAAPPGTRFAACAATFAGCGAALMGDRATSDRAFDRARTLADDENADPAWGLFLDGSYIDVHQAQGRAVLGDYGAAIRDYAAAIARMRPGFTRDQAVYISRAAVAHARAGEIEPAAQMGLNAMRVGVSTGSERILQNVRHVDQLLRGIDTAAPEVAEFRDAADRWAVTA